MMSDEYGPALPPGLLKKKETVAGPELPPHLLKKCSQDDIGPRLPPSASGPIGPTLPSHLKKVSDGTEKHVIGPSLPPETTTSGNTSSDEESIGPSLPPHLMTKKCKPGSAIGPCLPPQMTMKSSQNIGPSFPVGPHSDSDDDTDLIGPMPSEMLKGEESRSTIAEIESRARHMRDRLEGKDKDDEKISRESWMTELPSANLSQSIGLEARSFRAKAGPDLSDRSAWTDTPSDREKKAKEESSRKRPYDDAVQSKRNKQMSEEVSKYNKSSSRSESLLDMHQKKLKKEKKKTEDKPTERRPFDREVDLQVNKFDDAQRKSIIKKSQKLDSRFSHAGSQFL